MTKLIRTAKGFKVEHNSEPKILHHIDGDWTVMLENSNCYMAYQGDTYTVRSKDELGKIGFYTGDSNSRAYDIYKSIEVMEINHY